MRKGSSLKGFMCVLVQIQNQMFSMKFLYILEAALAELSWFELGDLVHQQTFALLNLPSNLSAMCVVI